MLPVVALSHQETIEHVSKISVYYFPYTSTETCDARKNAVLQDIAAVCTQRCGQRDLAFTKTGHGQNYRAIF